MSFVIRKTTVLSMSKFCSPHKVLASEIRLINPNNCNGRPIDIGSVAYSNRQWTKQVKSLHVNCPNLVDLETLRTERYFCILNLARELQSLRPRSQSTLLKEILPVFDWMDCNNYIDFLCNEESFIKGYKAYTQYLIDRMKTKDHPSPITDRTAKDKQWICRRIARAAFPKTFQNIWSSEITLKAKQLGSTPIPDEKVMGLWELHYEIFTKFKDQCFNNSLFPPILETSTFKSTFMPLGNHYIKCLSPYIDLAMKVNKTPNKTLIPFLNYQTGKLNESHSYYKKNLNKIKELTENPRDVKRLALVKMAILSFIELFRILTRVNKSQLLELPFSSDYSIGKEVTNIQFKAIKYRAKNKEITLRIDKSGIKLFKEYLKLRKWFLNGKKCEYLFFSMENNNPKKLSRQFSDDYNSQLKLTGILSPTSTPLKDKDIRQSATLFSRKKGYSSKETALSNNHSVAVSENIYSTPSLETQIQELSAYWLAVGKASLFNNRTKEETSTISGNCTSNEKSPESIIIKPPIEPNCSTPQGCFFCKYYACHADETDIRKILNILSVAKLLWTDASDIEHSEQTYSLLILHLEKILSQIMSLSNNSRYLVERLKQEIVEDGYLSPFWEKRVDYYEEIGLLKL